MRILLDGYNLALAQGTGVATYSRNLSREMSNLGHDVSVLFGQRLHYGNEAILREIAFFDDYEKRSHPIVEGVQSAMGAVLGPFGTTPRTVPLSGAVITKTFEARTQNFGRIYNSRNIFRTGEQSFDLWGKFLSVQMPEPHQLAHWTYPLPMKAKGCPNVYTLHDLVPLRLPYTTLDKKRRYLNLLRRIAKTADHIVTVSEHSRRDIIELLGVPEAKVTNTYQSVHIPDEILKIDEAQVTRDVEGVAGVGCQEYLLYWGAIEPKKNVGRLIEAYLSSNIKTPLVIVGARAWKSDQELRLLNSVNSAFSGARSPGNRIVLLDYVPFRLLMSLIRGAKGAIFPSLYEGFGLPVLEAMLLGTPVICSDTSSLPEVAGDAALTVDPYNTDQLSSQITRLDSDADLRADLSRRGIARAARFSPDLFRQRMHEVYKTLV